MTPRATATLKILKCMAETVSTRLIRTFLRVERYKMW